MRTALLLPLLSVGLATATVAAPPVLLSSGPANAAVGVASTAVRLGFDQAVLSDNTQFSLRMTAMPGMKRDQPIAINAVNHDGAAKLDLGLDKPLVPGSYELSWMVANTTGETGKGVTRFEVH